MDNFETYESEKYSRAKPLQTNSASYQRTIFFRNVVIFLKIIIQLCLELCTKFIEIFLETKRKNLAGQVALVTGGANGLGRAIACELAQKKCNIAISDINFDEALKTAEFISKTYSVSAKAFKVDVSSADQIEKLKSDIESSLGPVDILVNNAGILPLISLREGNPKDIQKIIDVNLTSHFWTVRTFLDGMIDRKRGHIVAISSMLGKTTFPCVVAYAATKHGVRGFMNALYDELCVFNHDDMVKLTTVYPSFINTRKELGDILDKVEEFTPRMTPEFVAGEIVNAVERNKRDLNLPFGSAIYTLLNLLPDRTLKYARTKCVLFDHHTNTVLKLRKH